MRSRLEIAPTRRPGRVLLVDPHPLMRWAAVSWVKRCPGLEVCGMAAGVTHAFWAVSQSHPDVVVSELLTPQDLGFIRELHRQHPRLPILIFSIHDQGDYGGHALEAGACGFLTKAAGGKKLIRSIRAALRQRAGSRLRQ